MTAKPHLAGLSDEDRQWLEACLGGFSEVWDEYALSAWMRKLPPRETPLRLPALVGMVKVDLEHRWSQGKRVTVESYLKALPELGTAESVPAELVLAEWKVRRQCGVPVDVEVLAKRFPRQAEEVRRLIQSTGTTQNEGGAWLATLSNVEPLDPAPPLGPAASGVGALPEQFGRYRILKKLGQGGMGAVYLAHDLQLGRQVALKVPRLTPEDNPEVAERFYGEARAAATIDHPNICPVYDVGEVNGIRYLTMAYVEGNSLSEHLARGNLLSQRDAAALVRKLALALQEAHDRGVIHRDLKPSNIMLNRRGEPVVMDFGLARRVASGEARLTRSGNPLGTPAYMPPEQAMGNVRDMGPGCDVYSLGVILYELLTGRLPFEGPLAVVWGLILTQEPPRPSEYRPDLAPHLERICLKAMAKKVADRYASMAEFAAALDALPGGGDLPAQAVSGSPRGTRTPAGRGWSWWKVTVAAAVLLVLAGIATLLTVRDDKGTGDLSPQMTAVGDSGAIPHESTHQARQEQRTAEDKAKLDKLLDLQTDQAFVKEVRGYYSNPAVTNEEWRRFHAAMTATKLPAETGQRPSSGVGRPSTGRVRPSTEAFRLPALRTIEDKAKFDELMAFYQGDYKGPDKQAKIDETPGYYNNLDKVMNKDWRDFYADEIKKRSKEK